MPDALELLIASARRNEACALVTLVGLHGAAPRRIGAQMAVTANGEVAGSFSGGCLDGSVIEDARRALDEGVSRRVRYGEDSPYVDIVLPCGSGLDLQFDGVVPAATVDAIAQAIAARRPFALRWRDPASPPACVSDAMPAADADTDAVVVQRMPALRLVLAGAGDTLLAMCRLARAADIAVIALSPERDLRAPLDALGVDLHVLQAQHALPLLDDAAFDAWTAAITLFHDHDWELPFLQRALDSDACLVGAMGSPRAQALRLERLQALGVDAASLTRLRSPLGLLPRARDPQELAVSILAEAMQAHRERCHPADARAISPTPAGA
ncbi:XdhC family protein [Lysobacter hankyongensis]|uniref:Molybdenum cofactor insertion chaperone PaoD n=1 Tax=Lysobacter hankyongensis TaxID=1176535 RepID=A0ABP9B4Q4_9GAMM